MLEMKGFIWYGNWVGFLGGRIRDSGGRKRYSGGPTQCLSGRIRYLGGHNRYLGGQAGDPYPISPTKKVERQANA